MPVSITAFTDATTIEAADIYSKLGQIEDYINGGMLSTDIQAPSPGAEGWMKPRYIYSPDFYASPAPRAEMVSGDTHYRVTDDRRSETALFHGDQNVENYIAVPGLCATVKNHHDFTVRAHVLVSFYAYETGGDRDNTEIMDSNVARFRLHQGSVPIPGTNRRLYNSTRWKTGLRIIARQNLSMIAQLDLAPGVNQIGVFCRVEDPPIRGGTMVSGTPDPGYAAGDPRWRHIFVVSRGLVVETHALFT